MTSITRICLIPMIPLLISGCALNSEQREATRQFAYASANIGEFSVREFNHLRENTIDMNVSSVALRGHAKLFDDSGVVVLDEALKPQVIMPRIKAAQALSSYGKLLLALVEHSQDQELKRAANDFVGSFRSIEQLELSEKQLQGLGRLVQSIGSIWVDAKKAEAIEEIVPAVSKDVDKLCTLLIQDFSASAENVGQGYDATISNLLADSAMVLKDPKASYSDRFIAVNGVKHAWEERAHLTMISTQAVKTLKKLRAANQQLTKAVKEDDFEIDDILAVGKEVNSLRMAISTLSSDY